MQQLRPKGQKALLPTGFVVGGIQQTETQRMLRATLTSMGMGVATADDGSPCSALLETQPCTWTSTPQLIGRDVDALPNGPLEQDYPYASMHAHTDACMHAHTHAYTHTHT